MVETETELSPTSPPRGAPLERGQTVGRFVVIGPLGAGGMGEVFAAYDPELDRKVAVKLLQTKLTGSAMGRALLLREAQATAKLQHPNVVVVYDVGTLDDRVFIAMEFVEGHTLKAWLRTTERRWPEVLKVFISAGRGLEAAHAAGLVHRDFKPDNVMLSRDGQVRVMDFGLARAVTSGEESSGQTSASSAPLAALDESELEATAVSPHARATPYLHADLTETGARVGTPVYMSPEQFLRGDDVDARSDQFSFCVALYEALYGERPFGSGEPRQLMWRASIGKMVPPPAQTRVPPWIRRIVLRGLLAKREERWPTMSALLAALADDPTKRRRKWLAVGAGVAFVAASAFTAHRLGGAGTQVQCGGGATRLVGVWDTDGAASPRKTEIHRAFDASATPFSEQAFVGVTRLLDRYTERWVAGYRDACEATHVRGAQSAEVLDLRMGCLDERLGNLRALTDLFTHADASVVENAVSAAGALPALDLCSDSRSLRAVVKAPDDAATVRRVELVRERLARFIALRDAGQCAAVTAQAETLIEDADAIGYDPLRADVLLAAGLSGDTCEDLRVENERLKRAFNAANAGRSDQTAAEAAAVLPTSLERRGEHAEAREWLAIARGAVERLTEKGRALGWLLLAEGDVSRVDGDFDRALASTRQSFEVKRRVLGLDNPDSIGSLQNVALILSEAGRPAEAYAVDREALDATARVVGPEHPLFAMMASNTGEVLNDLHRYGEAREHFQQALNVWRRAGADASFLSYGLTGLGLALLGEGRDAEAEAPLEEALVIRTSKHAYGTLMGETRFALARALWSRPPARRRALALATAARNDVGPDEKKRASIDAWLAGARSRGAAATDP